MLYRCHTFLLSIEVLSVMSLLFCHVSFVRISAFSSLHQRPTIHRLSQTAALPRGVRRASCWSRRNSNITMYGGGNGANSSRDNIQRSQRNLTRPTTALNFSNTNSNTSGSKLYMSSSMHVNRKENEMAATIASPITDGLNANQYDAVTQPVESISRVIAGPGSGKTRVLTSRIAWLLDHAPQNERILAVTFTKKAASEMQTRLTTLVEEQAQQTQQQQQQQSPSSNSQVNPFQSVWEDSDDEVGSNYNQQQDDVQFTSRTNGMDRVTLGTFHSVCARILRWNGKLISTLPSIVHEIDLSTGGRSSAVLDVLDGQFNIADQAEQLRIQRDVLVEYGIDLANQKGGPLKPLQILNTASLVKSEFVHGRNPFMVETSRGGKKERLSPALTIVKTIYYRCRAKLLLSNTVTFDDLIQLTREMLHVHDETVGETLRRRWKHVLVDEFQDTSQSQFDLIKSLSTKSLLVVGDADQSIYSWRGAHTSSLTNFDKEFTNHCNNAIPVTTVYLMENYRSTSNIVKAAQKIISTGEQCSDTSKLRQEMKPQRERGIPPRVMACNDGEDEADHVVGSVVNNLASGVYKTDHTVAFIYRTNAQSRFLEEACVQANLPYVIFGSATSFYKRQEIKDCLCYVRWLYNGLDKGSMLRAMTTPKRGIGEAALKEFDEYCELTAQHFEENAPNHVSLPSPLETLLHLSGDDSWCDWDTPTFPPPSVSISTRPVKLFTAFSKQMSKLRNVAGSSTVAELLDAVVINMGLEAHLDKISKSTQEFAERWANVGELKQASERYNEKGICLPLSHEPNDGTEMEMKDVVPPSLGDFLDDVSLVTEMAEKKDEHVERLVVNMMTIHASKGMEFDTVFFVGMEQGTLPSHQSIRLGPSSVELQEEQRLCYVGMTRAKTELVMSWRREVPVFSANGISYMSMDRSNFLDVLAGNKSQKGNKAAPSSKKEQPRQKITSGRSSKPPRSYNAGRPRQQQSRGSHQQQQTRKYSRVSPTAATTRPTAAVARTRPASNTATQQRPQLIKRVAATARMQPMKQVVPARAVVAPRQQPMSSRSRPPQQQEIDASWFYPVGSKVNHEQLGEGLVLESEGMCSNTEVQIKFRNGATRQFSIHGNDISPVISS